VAMKTRHLTIRRHKSGNGVFAGACVEGMRYLIVWLGAGMIGGVFNCLRGWVPTSEWVPVCAALIFISHTVNYREESEHFSFARKGSKFFAIVF